MDVAEGFFFCKAETAQKRSPICTRAPPGLLEEQFVFCILFLQHAARDKSPDPTKKHKCAFMG